MSTLITKPTSDSVTLAGDVSRDVLIAPYQTRTDNTYWVIEDSLALLAVNIAQELSLLTVFNTVNMRLNLQ